MKLNSILKNSVKIVKDEPINMEERFELLEKRMNIKISHFEDSMATVHSIIERLSDENSSLKEENIMLKKMVGNREDISTSLLDGIKERIVKPVMKEGKDMADIVFSDSNEKNNIKYTIEPETEFDKNKKKLVEPHIEEKSAVKSTPGSREKTIKWMRQRFGLSPQIVEKPKAKAKKARKK